MLSRPQQPGLVAPRSLISPEEVKMTMQDFGGDARPANPPAPPRTEPHTPVYARRRRKTGMRPWMVMVPVAALSLGGLGVLALTTPPAEPMGGATYATEPASAPMIAPRADLPLEPVPPPEPAAVAAPAAPAPVARRAAPEAPPAPARAVTPSAAEPEATPVAPTGPRPYLEPAAPDAEPAPPRIVMAPATR
jgi:hypothetical protein